MRKIFKDGKQIPNRNRILKNQHLFSPAKATSNNSFPNLTISDSSSGNVPNMGGHKANLKWLYTPFVRTRFI